MLTELQNEYDAINEELQSRSAEFQNYAEQLACKITEIKSLEALLLETRSDLTTNSSFRKVNL